MGPNEETSEWASEQKSLECLSTKYGRLMCVMCVAGHWRERSFSLFVVDVLVNMLAELHLGLTAASTYSVPISCNTSCLLVFSCLLRDLLVLISSNKYYEKRKLYDRGCSWKALQKQKVCEFHF